MQRIHRIAKTYGSISPDTSSAKHFAHFGWGALITFPQGSIFGEQSISIGDNTLISEHVTLSVGYMPGVPTLADSALVIGDRCVVGARCTLTAHGRIELGDDVGRQMGEHQPISIGAGSWIGHGAVILPGTTVGRNVVVAAGAVVRGEVPDHSVVAGVPAKIVRRFEPDVGWVSNSGDVRPIIDFEVAANALSQLGDAVEGFTGPLPK